MSKILSIDIDDLTNLKQITDTTLQKLIIKHMELVNSIEDLRRDWHTDAGIYFFDRLDKDWEAQIKSYEETLTVFSDVLDEVIQLYSEVIDKASLIQFR